MSVFLLTSCQTQSRPENCHLRSTAGVEFEISSPMEELHVALRGRKDSQTNANANFVATTTCLRHRWALGVFVCIPIVLFREEAMERSLVIAKLFRHCCCWTID
jgi:hypothetical protein